MSPAKCPPSAGLLHVSARKLSLILPMALSVWLLLAMASPAFAADWYASPTGAGNHDCMSAANACDGIQAAIDKAAAYDRVYVLAGNYPTTSQRIRIEKEGLQLIGEHSPFALPYATPPGPGEVAHGSQDNKAANASVLKAATASAGSGNTSGMIWVRNVKNVRIENLYIEHGSRSKEAIVATGYVDGLAIVNNYIKVTSGISGVAISFNVWPGRDSSVPESETRRGKQFVTIDGNVIEPGGGINIPKRAIAMEYSTATISNNQVAAHTQDMWLRYVNGTNKDLTISDNWFFGRLQLHLTSANAHAQTIVEGNHFDGTNVLDAGGFGNGSEALSLRIDGASGNAPTIVRNNEFKGFGDAYRALWVSSRDKVTIRDNSFTPAANKSEFTAIVVGNREMWNGLPAPRAFDVTILGNTFNASAGGSPGNKGKAILFVNDNDHDGAASATTLKVGDGTAANANQFDSNIGWYIALDDRTCTAQNHNTSGSCNGAASYLIGEGIAYGGGSNQSSQKRPFKWDVDAAGNSFGGVLMADMDQTQYDAVLAKTFADHNKVQQDAAVGDVLYGWLASAPAPDVELIITELPGNDHKTGSLELETSPQFFTLAARNNGGDGVVVGRITVTRADGALIPMQDGGMSAEFDALAVGTVWGPAELFRAADGKGVSLIWPDFDVPLAHGDELPPQDIVVLFRVPGEYHVHAEIVDAADHSISYGDTAFDYAVTQDLEVQITGTNPTVYNGGPQPLGFTVSPASNPAVADLAAKVGLTYDSLSAVPTDAGIYTVDATSSDADYVITPAASTTYTIAPMAGSVLWGALAFDYDGQAKTISANHNPLATGCVVSPASVGPDIGSYDVEAVCDGDANHEGATASAVVTIGGAQSVHVQETGLNYASVADALADAQTLDGMTVQLAPGTYSGPIVLTKGVSLVGGVAFMDGHGLVLTAGPIAPPSTVIDGGHSAATGILVANGVQGATISGVEVTAFTQDCIFAQQGNDGLRVEESIVHDCGRHGIYVNGVAGIADVSIERNHVHNTGNRGIVVWNGFKQDITINDNLITGPIGATAIGFEDGTAAGVHITNNEIDHSLGGDTGIAIMQLTAGAASARGNLISNNTITDPGRHGIALMIPNGSGKDSGDGSIVVEGNTITGGTNPGGWADDDRAGIQVVRRYYAGAGQGQVDVTQGAVIRNNQVTDVVAISGQPAGVEGYGIVVEGLGSSVYDNILERNDVGLQIQQGNQPASLPGDSALGTPSDWFDRGNAPLTCVGLGDNVFADNTMHDTRFQQPAGSTDSMLGGVHNEDADTWHCSINAAIAAATAGDTLSLIAGIYGENVIVNKTVTIKGPKAGVSGFDPARDGSGEAELNGVLTVRAADVVVDGVSMLGSGTNPVVRRGAGGDDGFQFINNRAGDIGGDFLAVSGTNGWEIRNNLFHDIGGNAVRPHGGVPVGMVVDNNHFETVGVAVQMISNSDGSVTNNSVDGTTYYAVQIANSSNMTMHGNTIRAADMGLLLDRNNADVVITCNDIEGINYGIGAAAHIPPGTETMTILHNRVVAPEHLRTLWGPGETFAVGSNYYDGAAVITSTPNDGEVAFADALPVSPIGNALCGDNTPVALVTHAGTPQSAVIGTAFDAPLQARVVDALGGAVAGETVTFAAPQGGPGAVLSATSADTDYNGVAEITAEANYEVGTYAVEAASGAFAPAEFNLTNTQGTAVVTVTDVTVTYDGQPHAVGVSTDPAGLEGDVQVSYQNASNTVVATCDATDAACGPVDAGVYTATATLSGNPNYGGSGSGTLTITQAAGTVEWLQTSFVYDGSIPTATARIAEEPASACAVTGTVGPDVGTYPISASCSGDNYTASGNSTAEVTQAVAGIAFSHLVQPYDGSPKSVVVTTTPAGLPVTVTYDGSVTPPTAVGTYAVAANVTDANYTGSASATLDVVQGASDIALVLNGPVDPIHVGDTAQYAATMLANPALHSGKMFGYKVTLNKSGGNHPLELDDLATMEVFYQGTWVDATQHFGSIPFVLDPISHTLTYFFPDGILSGGFPIEDASWTWNFRFSFADTGTYTTTAELVDGGTHDPINPGVTASIATVVEDALPPNDMHLILGGPAGNVTLGSWAEYNGTLLADPALHVGETFFVKVTVSKSGGPMTAADFTAMQIFLGGAWVDGQDLGVTFIEDNGNLVYLFPESQMPGGFPIEDASWTWNFRFIYADTGVYTATAQVIPAYQGGVANPDVYASAAIATTVVAAPVITPDMNLIVLGPVDHVEVGSPATYVGTLLANPNDFTGREFFVRVRLSKNGGADVMSAADLAKMELYLGGWQDATNDLLPHLVADGNDLIYLFPQPYGSFPIADPVWSWNFRFTYASVGVYSAVADVIDAADPDPSTAAALASDSVQTNVVVQSPNVSMQLNGPVAGVEVDVPAAYIGRLINHGPDLPENAFVKVSVIHDGGQLALGDVTTEVWFGGTWVEGTLLPDGSGGLEVDFPDSFGFPVYAGFDYTHQFRITYHKPGVFTATATLVGADSGDFYATSGMYTQVVPRSAVTASVLIDPASLHAMYDGQPHAAVVSSTPAVQTINVTYDGDSMPPTNAGSYVVIATVDDPVYVGSASAILVIEKAVGTIAFTPLSGEFGTAHAVSVTVNEDASATCVVNGVPGWNAAVGSYALSANCSSSNYTASGTATYQVTAPNAAIASVVAAPVGVVTVDPQPDADAKKSYYSWATSGSVGENVRGGFVITSSNWSVQAGDLAVEYYEPVTGDWLPLPLTFNPSTGQWTGDFGPAAGFPLTTAQSQFRASFNKGGRYTTTAHISGVSGLLYASSAPVVTEVADIDLVGSGNAAGVVGVAVDTGYALVNSGTAALSGGGTGNPIPAQPAPNDENVRGRFFIEWDGGALTPADPNGVGGNGSNCGAETCASPDIAVEFFDAASSSYQPIYNLRAELDGSNQPTGRLYGHFGAASSGGVPVPAGYSGTYLFRTTSKTHTGNYTVVSQVVGIDTGTVYAQAPVQTIAIDTGNAASIEIIADDFGVGVVGGIAYGINMDGSLRVLVRDSGGNPVDGASVAFNVPVSGASAVLSAGSCTTDASGECQITVETNTVAGTFVVEASIANGQHVEFDLTNYADTDPGQVEITIVSGDAQTAPVDGTYGLPLVAKVTDRFGNALEGLDVQFSAPASGASVSPASVSTTSDIDGLVASGTFTANSIAGAVPVSATVDAGQCTSTLCSASFMLQNSVANVSISDIVWADTGATSIAYDGSAKSATATVTGSSLIPNFTYNGSSTAPSNAGSYQVIATIDDGNVYGTASAMLTITPAAVGDSGIDLTGGSFTYDGSYKPATVANPNGVAYALTYDTGNGLPPVNVGTYTATLTVNDPNHAVETLTATIEITPAAVELSFGNLSHVYDGTVKTATVTTSPAGVTGVSLAYDATPVDAGSYTVTASLSNPNFTLTGPTEATLVINQATAQIFLSGLNHVFDGTVKSATVTTVPAALAANVVVTYTPASPINVGSYAVEASLVGQTNYADTPVTGTLTIVAATVAGFEIDGADTFNGVAGEALTAPLPTVRVFDTANNGVAGISVSFQVTAGGGSILGNDSATVTTDSSGLASVPEWMLGAIAGNNTMTASTGMAGLPALSFNAIGTQVADLTITKTVDRIQAHAGQVLTWTIEVENAGPSTVDAELLDAIPAGVDDIQWDCVDEGGASCGVIRGTGDISFTSTIPAGGRIIVVISATVTTAAPTGQPLVNEAAVSWQSQNNPETAVASASVGIVPAESGPCSIFCDGFEGAGRSIDLVGPKSSAQGPAHVGGWQLQPPTSGKPVPALELLDAHGSAVAWVDVIVVGNSQRLRLRQLDAKGAERASAWFVWSANDVLGYQWDQSMDGLMLQFRPLTKAGGQLELQLPPGTAIPQRVRLLSAVSR